MSPVKLAVEKGHNNMSSVKLAVRTGHNNMCFCLSLCL